MALHADLPLGISDILSSVVRALDGKKAFDIITIDLRGKSDIADFMVIASGNSATHNQALSDTAEMTLRAHGASVLSIEGKSEGNWVLIDTPSVVVHIFRPETRQYYGLERMWQADFSQADAIQAMSLAAGGNNDSGKASCGWIAEEAAPGLRVFRTMVPA